MVWQLVISATAEKQLAKLDKGVLREVKKYLVDTCSLEDPASRGHPLTGPWAGFHRYRLGQLRMIVKIERQVITITLAKIDRRDSAYN